MTDLDLTQRIEALEAQIRTLTDRADAAAAIMSYGPMVDSGDAEGTRALFAENGSYDVDELVMPDPDSIEAMVHSTRHQAWINNGAAHFLGTPTVQVDGDDAIAVSHSLMVIHENGEFIVRRATANHWTLHRENGAWRIVTRLSRVLDGRAESRALLNAGVRGKSVDAAS